MQDCWGTVKAAINDATEIIIGYVERSQQNEWFDGEIAFRREKRSVAGNPAA